MADEAKIQVLIAKAKRLEEQVQKHAVLLDIIKAISAETDLDRLLQLIMQETTRVMEAERSTLFILDRDRGELWSKVALGLEHQLIRLKLGTGIAGSVALTGETLNIPEAYQDPRFNPEVDRQTGYRTRTILCMPVRHKDGRVVGVLQVLNKKRGVFNQDEEGLLKILCSQAAIALENAQLYENLRRAYRELQELDRLKTDFLANISHELRTPLAPIIGYLEMLLAGYAGPLTAKQRSSLDVISQSVQRLRDLIEQLLAFVQIDRGELRLSRQRIPIGPLLQGQVEAFRTKAEAKGIALALELPPSLPEVLVDPQEVGRAVALLLDNAMKFTPDGGRVVVAVRRVPSSEFQVQNLEPGTWNLERGTGEFVEISITDTGIGIPEDQHQKIFDRFYQVDSSATRRYGGTGLGLALVKQIVEAHGSKIEVESRVGQGSTFRFRLPVAG
ncbi:MAG: ATP-binding protein [Candidatus Methylomirabilales bacterium]